MDAEDSEGTPVPADEAQTQDPLARMQALIGELDPTALVVGFATVVEWLEADGSRTLSVIGTDMDPWHAYGLLTYGRQSVHYAAAGGVDFEYEDSEDDD